MSARESHLLRTVCPWCAAEHDLQTGIVGQVAPADGDRALCIACRRIGVFDMSLPGRLRAASEAEAAETLALLIPAQGRA